MSTDPAAARGFRGDVQGLRAVAVLIVILAHFGLGPFPGGYVGVDVFFVISGFLISGLLFREIESHGQVSLGRFYARRARRILPAATIVIVATVVAAAQWMSRIDADQVKNDAVWSALFAANIRFATIGSDYFAQDELPSPLQHYWSLAVEEQFYLAWPLLLLGLVLVARRRRPGSGLPRRAVGWALGVIAVLSFGYSVVHTATDPTWAYFSTFTRAWELAAGALLALVPASAVRQLTMRARSILSLAGLLAILIACLGFGDHTAMPGSSAALPVLGTVAVLLAGTGIQGRAPRAVRWLGVRPMRAVGDWSYSLYLWHWPILVVWSGHLGHGLSTAQTLVALVATFVLAAATHRLVEAPWRQVRLSVPRTVILYPASIGAVALIAALAHHAVVRDTGDNPAITLDAYAEETSSAAPVTSASDETVALVKASVLAARDGAPVPSKTRPDLMTIRTDPIDLGACDYAEGSRELCLRGDADGDKTLVLIGDSHARHWIPAFDRIAGEAGWRAYYLVMPNCSPVDRVVSDPRTAEPFDDCTDFKAWMHEQVSELQPDLAVVSATPPTAMWVDGERDSDPGHMVAESVGGYQDLFSRLHESADRVVLMPDVAKGWQDPPSCLTTGRPDLGDCAFEVDDRIKDFRQASVQAAKATDTEIVDPLKWVCWRDECPAVIGDLVPYRDRGHLTAEYAEYLATPLGQQLDLLE